MAQNNNALVLKRAVSTAGKVVGMAALGGCVYVVIHEKADGIEIYDSDTLASVGRLHVGGSRALHDIAASKEYRCLYVTDTDQSCVYRVEIPGVRAMVRWSVGRKPIGVATSIMENVLVVSQGDRKIQEYTTFGELLKTIDLKGGIGQLAWNVAQLSTGEYAVTYNIDSRVDSGGISVLRDDSDRTEDYKKLQSPRVVITGQNDCIVVAVYYVSQVVIFDKTLSRQKTLDLPLSPGASSSHNLCLDESRDTLYYAEWEGRRLASFGNANNAIAI